MKHAEVYDRDVIGDLTSELSALILPRRVLGRLYGRLYGRTAAAAFGALAMLPLQVVPVGRAEPVRTVSTSSALRTPAASDTIPVTQALGTGSRQCRRLNKLPATSSTPS